jgi:hypothetical protein
MSEPEASERLRELTDEYVSGLLDEGRLAELEGLLRADAGARRYFVRYCRLHTDLHLEVRARSAGERALLRLVGESGPDGAGRPAPRRRWLTARWQRAALVAASLLAAAGAGWWLAAGRGERPPEAAAEEVAWLVNAQDIRWADERPLDGALRAGAVLRIEHGLAELRFRSGARVVLEGPAGLELLSGNSARLLRGRLTARVPEPAIGFTVFSPEGKVVDLGTEFGVAVGDGGGAEVFVFEGQVVASAPTRDGVSLRKDQAARLDASGVAVRPEGAASRYVRAIVPPPVIVPRTMKLDFRKPVPGTLRDAAGRGTGVTHRLPGTGAKLTDPDGHLRLNTAKGLLELTTTNSDLNNRFFVENGEYFGLRLADLGFTGTEDFAVSATVINAPPLKVIGQFGLYAGVRSDRNIRGGVFSPDPGKYILNLVLNEDGRDRDSHFVGLLSPGNPRLNLGPSPGDDLRLTLRRAGGKYTLTVENCNTGGSSTLATRHPAYLDGARDLYVGLFGANTGSDEPQTVLVKELQATVWTVSPPPPAPAP